MEVKNFKSKFFVFILGLLFALIIFECSLRILGFVDNYQRSSEMGSAPSSYRVMCLGNSYTIGNGAPPGKSYPAQLNEILNKRNGDSYRVSNRGRSNVNTSYIAENLLSWLEEDKPDQVFIMVGEPNAWNKYNYWKFLDKTNNKKTVMDSLHSFLMKFKTMKMIELFIGRDDSLIVDSDAYSSTFKNISLNENDRKYLGYVWIGNLYMSSSFSVDGLNLQQAREAVRAMEYVYDSDKNVIAAMILSEIYLIKYNNEERFVFYFDKALEGMQVFNYGLWNMLKRRATLFKSDGVKANVSRFEQRLKSLHKTTSLENLDKWASYGDFHFDNKDKEIILLNDIELANPGDSKIFQKMYVLEANPDLLMQVLERSLILNPMSQNAFALAYGYEIVERYPNLKPRFNTLLEVLSKRIGNNNLKSLVFNKSLEEQWIVSDLEEMIKTLKEFGVKKIVVQTYPPLRSGNERFADGVLRRWWEKTQRNDVEFMDVGNMLKDKFSKAYGGEKYYSTDFGSADDHQNADGYREISKLMDKYVP